MNPKPICQMTEPLEVALVCEHLAYQLRLASDRLRQLTGREITHSLQAHADTVCRLERVREEQQRRQAANVFPLTECPVCGESVPQNRFHTCFDNSIRDSKGNLA